MIFFKSKQENSHVFTHASESPVVAIMGMMRSGTSLVARMLNLCGLYLDSPRHMIPPTDSNPTGHWELKEFMELNNQLLEKFGGSWDHPPRLIHGWEADKSLAGFYEKAGKIIRKRFRTQTLWGWKDPRASLTFPFWKNVLFKMKSVICLRHPLDVARSLEARNGIPVAHGLHLWLHYINRLLSRRRRKNAW